MNELTTLKDKILSLSDERDDLIDKYMELKINFNLKLVTSQFTGKQKYIFLTRCGLTSDEIEFYDKFNDTNFKNDIDYIIDLLVYYFIKTKIFKSLFSILITQSLNYLLE